LPSLSLANVGPLLHLAIIVLAGTGAVVALGVRIELRQPLVDEQPHGLLERLRGQGFC
jgi:hypothetical protein